jgi:hypothetical protein
MVVEETKCDQLASRTKLSRVMYPLQMNSGCEGEIKKRSTLTAMINQELSQLP